MIASLTGRVVVRAADHCVLDVAGVGYRVAMSTGSLAALPAAGDTVTLHTHLHVRPEELALFGFENLAEKGLFEKLITVSGVGPKVALAALSAYPADTLTEAIVSEDVGVVSSIPGVGKKTAQRIILDLKDKLGHAAPGAEPATRTSGGVVAEARDALLAMGFSAGEVATALKGLDADTDAESVLKAALKRLGGGA